jgi:two-component system cell cycle sensor histidine kinase/response regulator CckA
LLFSRKQVVNMVPLNINDVVCDIDPMLRRLIRENIVVRSALDPQLGDVTADPTQVQQAIMNLVVNASDAMPDGGTLTIETHNVTLDAESIEHRVDVVAGNYVQLTISDTGIGMDNDTKGKIFEPFFTTKAPGVGTGLGLATTYGVVQQLGGHLRVYSELGNGSALKIFLPRLNNAPSRARVTPLYTAAVAYAPDAVTVLLVEDEPSVRTAIRRTLERFGFSILEACDGETALAVAQSNINDIDIVLTDLMMPGMNGRTFADQLANIRRDLPVIFMSGYTDDTVNQRGLVDATHAFLQKPFSGEQLARTVRELLQEDADGCAAASGTANASVGGLP